MDKYVLTAGICAFGLITLIFGSFPPTSWGQTPTQARWKTVPNGTVMPGTYNIDGYKIHIKTEDQYKKLKGDTIGYTPFDKEEANDMDSRFLREFYIQAGMSEKATEATCRHEHMHAMGMIFSEHSHDYIRRNQFLVKDKVCDKLMEKVEIAG